MHPVCIPFVSYAVCRMLQNFACLIEYIAYSHVKYIYYKIYKLGAKAPFSEPNICPKCKQETLYRLLCMCWQSFVITFLWNIQVDLNSHIFLISWYNCEMKHFFHLTNILYLARTFDARRLISLKTVYKIIFQILLI